MWKDLSELIIWIRTCADLVFPTSVTRFFIYKNHIICWLCSPKADCSWEQWLHTKLPDQHIWSLRRADSLVLYVHKDVWGSMCMFHSASNANFISDSKCTNMAGASWGWELPGFIKETPAKSEMTYKTTLTVSDCRQQCHMNNGKVPTLKTLKSVPTAGVTVHEWWCSRCKMHTVIFGSQTLNVPTG